MDKSVVHGIDQIAEIDAGGAVRYVSTDVLGSTVLVTDAGGAVLEEYEYDVFGSVVGMERNVAEGTDYLFTGQEFDWESELYYYNARYYDPKTGRFISRDRYAGMDGDVLSKNRYVYVKNNPMKYVDPSGRISEEWEDTLDMVCGAFTTCQNGKNLVEVLEEPVTQVYNQIDYNIQYYKENVEPVVEEVLPDSVMEWASGLTLIDVAEQTDAEDYSILIYGEHLDGTDASLFDYGVALGGFFIPAVSGSAVKNAGEGLIDWVRRGTGKKVDNVIDGSSEVVENGVSKGVKELEYGDLDNLLNPEWKNWDDYMGKRGWSKEDVYNTINNGTKVEHKSDNWLNPGNGMVRITDPETGKSLIQDSVTREIIQLGDEGYLF